jgi:hypothetical protein
MSAVQTSVPITPALGQPGLEYDLAFNDVVTKAAADPIPFGRYVVFTAEGTCELPDTLAEVTGNDGGVALRDDSKPSGTGYAVGDPVRVLVRGRVWVEVEQAVAQSNPAFVRAVAAGNEQQGVFRADADGTDAVATPNTNFFLGSTGAGLAVVSLNVPQGT